jgi:glycosyltransferase involved in cell wall biosynthesis
VRFSLILGTLGRTHELERFLQHLEAQEYGDVELIVVDQNPTDRLTPILSAYQSSFRIVMARARPGLSRARNLGLTLASGEVIAFPDDDCAYPRSLLRRVAEWLRSNPEFEGICGRTVDFQGGRKSWDFSDSAGEIDPLGVWRMAAAATMFLRRGMIARTGAFDETLGLGAGTPWGSAEETDYLIRCLERNGRIYYDPTLEVLHPTPTARYDQDTVRRGYTYGRGMGHVMRLHGLATGFVFLRFIRPLGGCSISLLTGRLSKARYHGAVFKGRIRGWLDPIRTKT